VMSTLDGGSMDTTQAPTDKTSPRLEDQVSNKESTPEGGEAVEGKIAAMLGYVPFLCFVPLFGAHKNRFAIQHGKQAFFLLVVELAALLFLVDTFSEFIWTVILIACLGLAFVAAVHASQGKYWKIPIIGDLIDKYEL
jgi:uncharacterized membrane protein